MVGSLMCVQIDDFCNLAHLTPNTVCLGAWMLFLSASSKPQSEDKSKQVASAQTVTSENQPQPPLASVFEGWW
jgi:hypothetical protein